MILWAPIAVALAWVTTVPCAALYDRRRFRPPLADFTITATFPSLPKGPHDMSDYSFPVPLNGSTHLVLADPVDEGGKPFAGGFPGPASFDGNDGTLVTLAIDGNGLGAVVTGIAPGTATINIVEGGITKTVDLVVPAPQFSGFTVVAEPVAPAAA